MAPLTKPWRWSQAAAASRSSTENGPGLTADLVAWAVAHQVSAAAITDGLIFMALTMVIVRTLGLGVRAARLPAIPALATQHG
jgi:hypothetical protein